MGKLFKKWWLWKQLLKTKHNQNKFRFKGLTKNQETAQIVNHESMENMVRGLVKEFVIE